MITEGIILAAGFSSRTDTYKLTLDLGGKTVMERCIEGMYDACSRVIVVGGYNIKKLASILDKYAKVTLIYNENYQSGMFSSVLTGFKSAVGDKIFIIPGDYPFVSPMTYDSLLNADGNIIIPTYEGIKGHPVLIKKSMVKKLLSSIDISSLKDFIIEQGAATVAVKCQGILLDIDTQEDYRFAQNYLMNLHAR